MRTKQLLLATVLATGVLTGTSVAGGPDLDGGSGKAAIAVEPAEGLGATATVQVSGTGYKPGIVVDILECTAANGTAQAKVTTAKDPVCNPGSAVTATTDADGSFGPVALEVARTFTGPTRRGDPETHDCLPQNDCQVWVSPKSGPNWAAWHHLGFAS